MNRLNLALELNHGLFVQAIALGVPKPGGRMGDLCHAITPWLVRPSADFRGLHAIIWPMNRFEMFKLDLVGGFLAIVPHSSKPSIWKRLRRFLSGREDLNSCGDLIICSWSRTILKLSVGSPRNSVCSSSAGPPHECQAFPSAQHHTRKSAELEDKTAAKQCRVEAMDIWLEG
jgi:hypothetical protein